MDKNKLKIWHKFAVMITMVVLFYLLITTWITLKILGNDRF